MINVVQNRSLLFSAQLLRCSFPIHSFVVVVLVCAVDTLCIFVLVYDHRRAETDNGLPTPKKGGRPALTAKSPSTDLVLENE